MEFSPDDLLKPEEILSDVLLQVDEVRHDTLGPGFFISQIRKCLKDLGFDFFFREIHKEFTLPENLVIKIPSGSFNIRQVYLFSGTKCEIGVNTKNVFWKRNFFSLGSGSVSKSKIDNDDDPFYGNRHIRGISGAIISQEQERQSLVDANLFFFGVENGNMMFSSSCNSFPKVLVKFNQHLIPNTDTPCVPEFFREVVTDWVVVQALKAKSAVDPNRWRILLVDAERRLQIGGFDGSWYRAETRSKRMDSKTKEDLKEYLARLLY